MGKSLNDFSVPEDVQLSRLKRTGKVPRKVFNQSPTSRSGKVLDSKSKNEHGIIRPN